MFSHKYEIKSGTKGIHNYAVEFEAKMIEGAVALKCIELKEKDSNLIIAQGGKVTKRNMAWSKNLILLEFYYNTHNSDIDFDLNEEHHPNDGYDLFLKFRLEMHLFKNISW